MKVILNRVSVRYMADVVEQCTKSGNHDRFSNFLKILPPPRRLGVYEAQAEFVPPFLE